MKTKLRKITVSLCVLAVCCGGVQSWAAEIVVRADAPELEQYAAKELQRYLYLAAGVKPEIRAGTGNDAKPETFVLKLDPAVPGPQGYALKRTGETVTVAGSDSAGLLYGVYGLLQDHYGIGFYFSGDTLPETKQPLLPAKLDETKKPIVAVRGVLPWTDFPQSPSSYSWEDWKFVIDQMAKMRLNFLHIHNYSGQGEHNESFHNFELNGWMSRVFMTTARTGHAWSGPGWDVNQYRFGAADLFDDYDFGADCTLHNESLSNAEVFRKGASEFQKIIAYAHSRGVKIGLGLDIDMILGTQIHPNPPPFPKAEYYQAKAADPAVIQARVKQIVTDYPDLDCLVCFQSECIAFDKAKLEQWQGIFDGFYREMKRLAPNTRIAVSGWSTIPWSIARCAPDVILTPINRSNKFDSGASCAGHEYWGSPWLEADGNCSQYYYPYGVHLSILMKQWQARAPNTTGLSCLTWRMTDAMEPKLAFISNAPWDSGNRFATSRDVYRDYAVRNYGAAAADAITAIINQNEPFASGFAECQMTPYFSAAGNHGRPYKGKPQNVGAGKMDQYAKAVEQLKVIDRCIAAAAPAQAERLKQLRCRIAATRDHILLNHQFSNPKFTGQADLMQSWMRNFTHRVNDISSLGNIVSVQNRFVQQNYLPKEKAFLPAKPVADAPLHPVVVSPPTSVPAGQTATVKVRVLDSRAPAAVSATLHWRTAGADAWTRAPMTRRVKAIFTGAMPAAGLTEYYVTVAEGERTARFPVSGSLTFVTTGAAPVAPPSAPANLRAEKQALAWDAVPGAFWYRIYRDGQFLTYVAAGTLTFTDAAPGFDGRPLTGAHTYHITAADKNDHESVPAAPVAIIFGSKK